MAIALEPALPGRQRMTVLRVLIVEDDPLIAFALEEVLAGMGHVVCATVDTETQAVAAADQQRPDLMLVDAGLREGSGIAAVEKILRAGPVAHVFITGDPGKVQASRPGAAFLRKPFREADLTKAIESAMKSASVG